MTVADREVLILVLLAMTWGAVAGALLGGAYPYLFAGVTLAVACWVMAGGAPHTKSSGPDGPGSPSGS